MQKKTIGIIGASTAVAALLGGTAIYQSADTAVNVTADGATSRVHLFGQATVADALSKDGISVGSHDVVVPSLDSQVSDGQQITVGYGRPLTVTIDGKQRIIWTTAQTVDAALVQAGLTQPNLALSVSRSAGLGRDGLSITATTPKKVSLSVAGKASTVTTPAATVGALLATQKVTLGALDSVSPAASTPVTAGMKVVVNRVTRKTVTEKTSIAYQTVKTNDSSLAQGTSKVTQQGTNGETTTTFQVTFTNGKVTSKTKVTAKVTKSAVTQKVTVGTKVSSSTSSSSSGGASNLANSAMWDRIAQCESGGNWSINTGNGYYGGLQFDLQTWAASGGTQFASRPDLATKAQQITVANRLYAQRGLSPWGCAGAA